MTQQWGTQPGQQPAPGSQQWPAQPGWNRPAPSWGPPATAPAYPQYPPAQPQYPQSAQVPYAPQAAFGQPAYGQPGGFQPGNRAPQPRRGNPLRAVLLGLVLVIGVGFFAVSLLHYLGGGDNGVATPSPTAPTAPPVAVPAPNFKPPAVPQPETYTEATDWLTRNKAYAQTAPIPTDCQVQRIDITTAPVGELTSHLTELTACLWRVWSGPLEAAGFELPRPPVTVYTEPITTGCGSLDEVNAVYCAADQRIYYAKPLYRIFPKELQRAPFVAESIIAHEFGHTIQARTGILIASLAWEQKSSAAEGRVFSRRLEVQADCFAGMFTAAVSQSSALTPEEMTTLQEVMYNLGDDVLTGKANYDGGHGLGKSRKAWFTTGQTNSELGKCNTYVVPPSQVR